MIAAIDIVPVAPFLAFAVAFGFFLSLVFARSRNVNLPSHSGGGLPPLPPEADKTL